MRRLLRAVPQPLFKAHGEPALTTQTLSTSRSMLLFNACMTLHSAAMGVESEGLGARAKENSAFLHHRRPPTEGVQAPLHRLYGLNDIRHRMHTLLSVFVSHSSAGSGGRLMSAIPPSTGVLLHGPSGCGKSSLTQQLATDFPAVPFFFVECTNLFSKFLGESEERLRGVYRRARSRAPAVVILEDIDVIAQSRGAMMRDDGGGGDSGNKGNLDVTRRMLAGLLCELDGVADNSGVLTIGVTNAPRVLDAAVLRQGRLESIVLVPPLTYSGAAELCSDFLKQFGGTEELRRQYGETMASRAVGCSAASLQCVLRKVFEQAVRKNGWAVAESSEGSGLPLPLLSDLHGLLFEHSSMLVRVSPSHFE
ncbi:putative ATPase domain protein [Leptomonas seymouri]|uniref:Putative ATPase domain protein n=1 Tax=Leptomonas seymouri TaxID=5684 RepID=A0A0N1HTJ8_LEPSE|nr:putative ATPase domain protein [Leptomonas seymouri]|eukprot:KPI84338.1 putative ATPase domain protein [Leptomonas seymouri]